MESSLNQAAIIANVVLNDEFDKKLKKDEENHGQTLEFTRKYNNQTPNTLSPDEIPTPSDAIHGRRDYFSYGQLLDNDGSADKLPLHVQPPYGVLSSRNPPKNLWRIVAVVVWIGSQGMYSR